ncbi:hypothetical protein [Lacunimicrobium album]
MKRFLPIIPTAASLRLIATHSLAITILLGMTALATADGPSKGGGMSRSMGQKMSSSFKQPSGGYGMPSSKPSPTGGFKPNKQIGGTGHRFPGKPIMNTTGGVKPIGSGPIIKPVTGINPKPVKPGPFQPTFPVKPQPGKPVKPPIKPFPPIVGTGGGGVVKPPKWPTGPIGPIGPVVGPVGPIGPKPPLGPIKPPIGPIGPVKPPLPFPPKPLPPKPVPPKPPQGDHDHDHHHHHPHWPNFGFWPVPRGPIYCPTPVINNACPIVISNPGVIVEAPVVLDVVPQIENGSEFTMLVEGDAPQIRLAVLMVNNTQMLLEITSTGQGYITMKMPQLLLRNTQPASLALMVNETTPVAQVNVEIIQAKAVSTVSVVR